MGEALAQGVLHLQAVLVLAAVVLAAVVLAAGVLATVVLAAVVLALPGSSPTSTVCLVRSLPAWATIDEGLT